MEPLISHEALAQISERIAAHLTRQRRRSMTPETDNCAYRGQGGATCAVGCLIHDSLYNPEMENKTAYENNVMEAVIASLKEDGLITCDLPYENTFGQGTGWAVLARLLRSWQSYHDSCCGGHSYNDWLEGSTGEADAPAKFHASLMHRLALGDL